MSKFPLSKCLPWVPPACITIALVLLAACGSSEPQATATPYPTFPPPTATPFPEWPDTNAASMMAYLEREDYQSSWELWPGKGVKYMTSGGHSVLLTTYVNPPAYVAVMGKRGGMPPNAIIVKNNYTTEGELRGTTVMYKVEGYYPEHNDWYWLKVLPDGTVDVEGTPDGCVVCHAEVKDNDYVWVAGPTSLSE